MNEGIFGVEEIKSTIRDELEEHYNLAGVQKIAMEGKTRKFVDLIGKLRFQKRWSQSPRVPETSVMGHVLVVAIMGYFCARKLGACRSRVVNDFWVDFGMTCPKSLRGISFRPSNGPSKALMT